MDKKVLIIVLSLFFLIPLFAFKINMFNEKFYLQEFERNSVYSKFNLSKEEVNLNAKNLISYLKSNEGLKTDFYSEKEVSHLKDVKTLISLGNKIFYFAILIFLSSLYYIKDKKKVICLSAMFCLVFYIILGLIVYFNFSSSFTVFHKLSFNNDNWMLSSDSTLIKLFPEDFFFRMTSRILITIIATLIIVMLFTKKKVKSVSDKA